MFNKFLSQFLSLGVVVSLLTTCFIVLTPQKAEAASAAEINLETNETLTKFRTDVAGAQEIINKSRGMLILPDVYQAGFGFGGEFGEGALRIGNSTVSYYNMASASWGFQLGAQKKSVLIFFMNDNALRDFRSSKGWEAGVDASIALVKVGAEGRISSDTFNQPIVAFVLGQKGLMYNLSLEGSKFTKINK